MAMLSLFPEYTNKEKRSTKKTDYESFVEKFKPKKTTDDCYTPSHVYDVVLQWVRSNCNIDDRCNIVRPFYPGGDYEAYEYKENDVVVDNPPFSIITKITRYYVNHGIRFFLFAPHLTVFQPGKFCTTIAVESSVKYENGAVVSTDFITNMLGDICVMSAPDLYDSIKEVQKRQRNKPALPKYSYPLNVIRISDISKFSTRGVNFKVFKQECLFVQRLDTQSNKGIFGGGYLISDRAAADRAAADRAAKAEAAKEEAIEFQLSDRERRIVENELNKAIELCE